ncbi:GNAT family N-acetyltransferase [Candidatus Bipolaricaulota bacterium]|nr:GNAT family N-acetyltransferase [Candidatus Bipolaricaulota bacterium]TFH11853.1 MAG: GNAT family N-acetyltransferase [Candidatus Atribacteria bacterium]
MFRIREATQDDNDALLHLEGQSPQGTGISIIIDRDDYFYRSQLHDRSKVLIAEEHGKLVGIMAYAIKDILVDGETKRAAYFYDLRGEATYRRSMKRGLFRLWRTALEGMEDAGASFIYGHVKADNIDSMNVSTKVGAQPISTFDILSLPSLQGRPPELDPHLGSLADEVEKISSLVGTRNLKPCDFSTPYERGAELGYLRGIFRIERGDSMAQVSAWDLSSIYRGRVLRMPLSLRVLAGVFNPLSAAVPVPRIPRVGEQMTYLQLFDSICQGRRGVALLKELIQQLRRMAYADGIDILTLFTYTDDPLAKLPRFFPEQILHYNTMMLPLCGNELPERPFYLDIRDI